MMTAHSVKGIVVVLGLSCCLATAASGAASCEADSRGDSATSLMQIRGTVKSGSERAAEVTPKRVTFVGKVGNEEWYLWFRKASNETGGPAKPVKLEKEDMDDNADLYALNEDGLAVASGREAQKSEGWWDDCPEIGLDIPRCRWHRYVNGWRWRHAEWDMCPGLGLHLPGCTGSWDFPIWRTKYEVAAAAPVNSKLASLELKPTHKEIRAVEDQIEEQMKAVNYKVGDTKPPTELEAQKVHAQISEEAADKLKDDANLADKVSKIVAAKMLFKRRSVEREMHFKQYEAEEEWAKHKIRDGYVELAKTAGKEAKATKFVEGKKKEASHAWEKAAKSMKVAEKDAGHSKKVTQLKADAEKYAAEEMKRQLSLELVFKDVADSQGAVLAVTFGDLLSDQAALQKLQKQSKLIDQEVNTLTAAQEDIIMAKANAVKPVATSLVLASYDTEAQPSTADDATAEQSADSSTDEVTMLNTVEDMEDSVREAVAKAHGVSKVSECAVKLASAKMAYEKILYLEKLGASDFADTRKFAEWKIKDGKKWLEQIAKDRLTSIRLDERNVSSARTIWEGLAHDMKETAGADKGEALKVSEEMKAEHELNMKLLEEQVAYWKKRISRRSQAENSLRKQTGAEAKEAEAKANAQWKEIVKKVNAEMDAQDKLIAKKVHG